MSVQLILNELKDLNENVKSLNKEVCKLSNRFESHNRYVEKNLKIIPVDVVKLSEEIKRSIPKNESLHVLNKINKSLERIVSDSRVTVERSKDIYQALQGQDVLIKDIKEKIDVKTTS